MYREQIPFPYATNRMPPHDALKEELREIMLSHISKDDNSVFQDFYELVGLVSRDLRDVIDSYVEDNFYELRKWSVTNYQFIEEALEEGMGEGVTDYHQMIKMGQFVHYRERAYDALAALYDEYDGELFNVEDEFHHLA